MKEITKNGYNITLLTSKEFETFNNASDNCIYAGEIKSIDSKLATKLVEIVKYKNNDDFYMDYQSEIDKNDKQYFTAYRNPISSLNSLDNNCTHIIIQLA